MLGHRFQRAVANALMHSFYFARGHNLSRLIRNFSNTQWLPGHEMDRRQLDQLKSVLQFAYRYIPFYRTKLDLAGVHPDSFTTFDDLKKIPPTTKAEITSFFRSTKPSFWRRAWFLSERRTSGSSGDPLLLLKDLKSQAVMEAVAFRNYSWFGIRPGDLQVRFWGRPFGRKRWVVQAKDLLLNRKRFSSFNISRDIGLQFLQEIVRNPPCYVYGYAQTIHQMAEVLAEIGERLPENRLKVVILTGEMVTSAQRQLVERVFNAKTVSEYGCTEAGVIAMECPAGKMHLMENLRVEVDIPSGQGHGEVLVTELTTDFFPLIRYQLGDLASLEKETCACGRGLRVLSGLQGRSDDLIKCPDGRVVDPYFFEYLISELPARSGSISKFKIIQLAEDEFEFLIVTSEDFTDEGIRKLSEKVKQVLGPGLDISLKRVAIIPKDPSGKLRCFSRMPRT